MPSLWLDLLAAQGEGLLVCTFFSFQIPPWVEVSIVCLFAILPHYMEIFLAVFVVEE